MSVLLATPTAGKAAEMPLGQSKNNATRLLMLRPQCEPTVELDELVTQRCLARLLHAVLIGGVSLVTRQERFAPWVRHERHKETVGLQGRCWSGLALELSEQALFARVLQMAPDPR